jgi:hypothetical protein
MAFGETGTNLMPLKYVASSRGSTMFAVMENGTAYATNKTKL